MNKTIKKLLYVARCKDGEIWPCVTREGFLKTWSECIDIYNGVMYFYYNVKSTRSTKCIHKTI